jgi:hypothetical protein
MVDGLRFGISGIQTVSPITGAVILLAQSVVTTALAYQGFKVGYKLKT